MNEKTLKQIFLEHKGKVSDKWSLYLDEWDRLFSPYHDLQINILEIGIQNGGSLEIWGKYFINAENIVGCDIDPKCECLQYNDRRVHVVIGDANTDICEYQILQHAPAFNIIIDDGSHMSGDIIQSFARYFPHLRDGGIYVVEDLHASYWKAFEGGLHNPLSAMSFFKQIADVINYEHWRKTKTRRNLIDVFEKFLGIEMEDQELSRIHSIEFVNSLCIIKKLAKENNILGKRVIVGTNASITNGSIEDEDIQESEIIGEDVPNSDIGYFASPYFHMKTETEKEQDINILATQLSEQYQVIQALKDKIDKQNHSIGLLNNQLKKTEVEIISYVTSKSWRFTRPFRIISRKIFGGKHEN